MHNYFFFLGTAMAMLKSISPYSNGVGEKGLEEIQTIVDSSFSPPEIRMLPNKLANSFGGLALQQQKLVVVVTV